jgi:hypothetical protein
MKKFYVILSICCISAFTLSLTVFAQMESYKWSSSYINNGKLQLGINYTTGGSYTSADMSAGISKWTSTSANLSLSEVPFSSSNVDIRTVDATTWTNNGWGSSTYGWTQKYAGSKVCSTNFTNDYCTSTDRITYAAIFLNLGYEPEGFWASTREDRRRALIGHELGHSFTIAHNALIGVESIMKTNAWNDSNFSYNPSSKDISDINSVYY